MYQQQPMINLRAVSTVICHLGTQNIEYSQKHELVLCALLARALLDFFQNILGAQILIQTNFHFGETMNSVLI